MSTPAQVAAYCVRTMLRVHDSLWLYVGANLGGRIQRLRGTTWRRGTLIEPKAWAVREHCDGCEKN